MARTNERVQEYIGSLLCLVRASVWDHPIAEGIEDDPDYQKAFDFVQNMLQREMKKNPKRLEGALKHLDEV